ncbi:MAG: hypothetical protein P1Q69_03565 [Candidatus Thorarchaeota archaeon]|nr:hypothetical protein [Candidatus Thorarchaeota archaeon]
MDDRRPDSTAYREEPSMLMVIGKYWAHGILYTTLMAIAIIPVLAVLLITAIIIPIIGIFLGLGVLFLAIGWINKLVAGVIWGIECRGHWQSLVGHGLGLLVGLLILSIPLIFIDLLFAYNIILYYLIQFSIVAIIQGILAKYVADYFAIADFGSSSVRTYPGRGAFPPPTSRGTPREPMTTCPYCNAVFPYREIDLSLEGTAPCRTCGAIIQDPRYAPGGPRRAGHPRSSGIGPEPSKDQDDTLWG